MHTDWREERRRDRQLAAQISRDDEEAASRLHREEHQAKQADRRSAVRQRATRRAERMAWLNAHLLDLLFIPVILVPAALAWTAMAAFGDQVFGAAGWALPAFSEGAMWAFAAATTITVHRHPQRPVWHLRLGTAVFAAVGAALNFIHGVIPVAGALRGPGVGVVMALVSVSGVVAHQFVTAGPRRSRAQRDAARLARMRERRERRIQRAAVRGAVAVIDAAGEARLIHQPRSVTLSRTRGRARLEDATVPQPLTESWPRPVPFLAAAGAAPAGPAGTASGSAPDGASGTRRECIRETPPQMRPAPARRLQPSVPRSGSLPRPPRSITPPTWRPGIFRPHGRSPGTCTSVSLRRENCASRCSRG